MKNLLKTLLIISTFAIGQNLENAFTVEGKTYYLQTEVPITYTSDKHDNWSLTGEFIADEGQKGILNIRTSGKMLASGKYGMAPNLKEVEKEKVTYSISIAPTSGSVLGALNYRQYTSMHKGQAIVSNENGVYAITLVDVEGINIKRNTFNINANITMYPSNGKSRKELNAENKKLNMSDAWTKEVKNSLVLANQIKHACNRFRAKNSTETLKTIEKLTESLIDSNDEILSILGRSNDQSIKADQIKSFTEIGLRKKDELKKFKKELNKDKISAMMDLLLASFGNAG
jgi:hypothetical protein